MYLKFFYMCLVVNQTKYRQIKIKNTQESKKKSVSVAKYKI